MTNQRNKCTFILHPKGHSYFNFNMLVFCIMNVVVPTMFKYHRTSYVMVATQILQLYLQ